MIGLKVKGDYAKTKKFLSGLKERQYLEILDHYGAEGVMALASATPRRTGLTSQSWDYKIERGKGQAKIVWTNSNQTSQGDSIAILLQYGHGTGTGGYVVGIDYINPAIRPVFDDIAEKVWEAVKRL